MDNYTTLQYEKTFYTLCYPRCSDHDPIIIGLALGEIHSDNTAIKQLSHPAHTNNTRKLLRNGLLIIIRDGVEYNAQGVRL